MSGGLLWGSVSSKRSCGRPRGCLGPDLCWPLTGRGGRSSACAPRHLLDGQASAGSRILGRWSSGSHRELGTHWACHRGQPRVLLALLGEEHVHCHLSQSQLALEASRGTQPGRAGRDGPTALSRFPVSGRPRRPHGLVVPTGLARWAARCPVLPGRGRWKPWHSGLA